MSDKELRRVLGEYTTEAAAIAAAKRRGNVAFVRDGKFLTCTRRYVTACINAGQNIEVKADHEKDLSTPCDSAMLDAPPTACGGVL